MTKIIGEFWAEIEEHDGNYTTVFLGRNLVTDVGENLLAWALAGSAGYRGAVYQMEIGTGVTAAAETDETLEYPITPVKSVGGSASGSVVDFKASWAEDEANTAITELGLWASGVTSESSLFNHLVFSAINKQSGQTLDITCKVTFD